MNHIIYQIITHIPMQINNTNMNNKVSKQHFIGHKQRHYTLTSKHVLVLKIIQSF